MFVEKDGMHEPVLFYCLKFALRMRQICVLHSFRQITFKRIMEATDASQEGKYEMYIGFNNNPSGKKVGDCAVRAISKALGMIWEDAYIALVTEGFKFHDMPSSNYVWGMLLHRHGFTQHMMPTCPNCRTVSEFAKEHPQGVYVLGTDSHVVTMIDGDWYDSWDSSDAIVNFYWSEEE